MRAVAARVSATPGARLAPNAASTARRARAGCRARTRGRGPSSTAVPTWIRPRAASAEGSSSSSSEAPPAPEPEPPARTFAKEISSIASEGLATALAAVDDRLSVAMRAEGARGPDDDDDETSASATSVARAAADAEREAVDIVACLASTGALRGFGAARLVPRRDYALSELKLNGIEAERLLSPTESTISNLRDAVSKALALVVGGWIFAAHPSGSTLAAAASVAAGALVVDQIGFGGGVEALVLDTLAQTTSTEYKARLRIHEAAHFLVAYLMGILPKGYTLSSLDAYEKYGALNVQAGCAFCDGAFQREVARGKIGSGSLGRFSCVALAGISMEYIAFGFSEGGVSDVRQLDGMLRALAFTQKKSDSEVRWAVLNTITLLRRHEACVRKLSEKMAAGASVGECVRLIEANLGDDI